MEGSIITGNEFSHIRHKASKRGLEFSISISDICDLYKRQNGLCALTGIEIFFNLGRKKSDKVSSQRLGNASVDRIDSSIGYILDNIQLVDKHVNLAKQQLSQLDFIELCRKVAVYNGVCSS